MNKKLIKLLSFCLLCMICFTSCERYPLRTLLGIPDRIDSWPDIWYIYDDEINTKGSLEPYLFDHNPDGSLNPYCDNWHRVYVDFACTDNPKVGSKCIIFRWIGNSTDASSPTKTFFSFGLQSREQLGGVVNLTNSGYTKMKFWIRGTLYNNCSFEISIPGTSASKKFGEGEINITPSWEEYEIDISSVGEIEFDLGMALSASGITNGGTVYIDDIRFVKEED